MAAACVRWEVGSMPLYTCIQEGGMKLAEYRTKTLARMGMSLAASSPTGSSMESRFLFLERSVRAPGPSFIIYKWTTKRMISMTATNNSLDETIHLPFSVKQQGRCRLLQRVHWLSVTFKNMHFVWYSVHDIHRELLQRLKSWMAGGKIQQSRPAPTHWWHRDFKRPGTDGSTLHWRQKLVHRRHLIIGSGVVGMVRRRGW